VRDAALVALDDLEDEYAALDAIVAGLDGRAWDEPTPAEGWAVRDQVFHLAFSEELATTALLDAEAFGGRLAEMLGRLDDLEREFLVAARAVDPDGLLRRWRDARSATVRALRAVHARDAHARVPWVSGTMSPASFATARLMETWAHGQDVVDALGVARLPTRRLRHIADLGVRTRAFSYAVHGLDVPDVAVLVRLDAPDGDTWTWGPGDAADRILGPAVDFCLVVTRRRHPDDTRLVADGRAAQEWLAVAQAFAGPATAGRRPGQFPVAAR
jgi:uncharacterized protein (TIGR03084 family)